MIRVTNLKISFASQTLFENVSFSINQGEKIGLVGRNGSGKTTLFKILTGELSPDEGTVEWPKNYSLGIVKQHINFSQKTVLDEACLGLKSSNKMQIWKIEKILFGLGFNKEDLSKNPNQFSGGYQVRLNLAKVLAAEPDLLLLDEPTNYLDIVSIKWITTFLRNWRSELILITHDRGFMDNIVTHTMAIHRHSLRKIRGNTSKIYEQLAKEEEIYEKTRINDEKKRKQEEIFINRFRAKARLAGLVQSRIKSLQKREKLTKLEKIENLEFTFNYANFNTKYMMHIKDISFGYKNSPPLISNFSLSIADGDKICIIGKNGKGKSTLLKLIANIIQPLQGEITPHHNTRIGYFAQTNVEQFHQQNTVEEELALDIKDATYNKIKNICGAMGFKGDLSKKRIGVLSGGEKSRISLGKILLKETNLLLLDEPTNHLDMQSADSLMMALDSFPGSIVMVTHNEMFLYSLATKLIIFDRDKILVFDGSYERFLENIGWSFEEQGAIKYKKESIKTDKKLLRKKRSEIRLERDKELKPILKKIEEVENNIEETEYKLKEFENKIIELAQTGKGKMIGEISRQATLLEEKIDNLYKKYEDLLTSKDEKEKFYNDKLSAIEIAEM